MSTVIVNLFSTVFSFQHIRADTFPGYFADICFSRLFLVDTKCKCLRQTMLKLRQFFFHRFIGISQLRKRHILHICVRNRICKPLTDTRKVCHNYPASAGKCLNNRKWNAFKE